MGHPFPATLRTLHEWPAAQSDGRAAMEVIGLLLHSELKHAGYWCTPVNAVAFASTGGDGVHFSLVDLGHGIHEGSPVVMTVPMARQPNWVLGAHLREFLALGLGTGHFSLEQLAYLPSWPANLEAVAGTFASPLLAELAEHFDLHPRQDVADRLRRLEERLASSLVVNDEPSKPD